MAYGSAKGRIFRGDIYAEDDSDKDTFIDWGNDYISFAVGGTKVLNVSSSGAVVQVLGTVSASSALQVAGATTLEGTLTANKAVTFNNTLALNKRATLNEGLTLSSSTAQTWTLPSTASQALLLLAGSGKDYMVFDTQGRNVVVGSNYATTNIGGKLIASSSISASSTLAVAGAVTHGNTLTVEDNITSTAGSISAGTTLFAMGGAVSGAGDLYTAGNLAVAGHAVVTDSLTASAGNNVKVLLDSGGVLITSGSDDHLSLEIKSNQGNISGSGNIAMAGQAIIAGAATLNGGATATTLAVSDLTSGRVVIAGSSGELQDNADLTYNGTYLQVSSQGGPGNVAFGTVTGSIVVLNAAKSGFLSMISNDGQVSASSHISSAGNLNLAGAANVNTLAVAGTSQFSDTVTVSGASDVGLNVSSVMDGGSSIVAAGNILAGNEGGGVFAVQLASNGNISGSGNLEMAGNTTVAGTFGATGATTLNGGLTLSSSTAQTWTLPSTSSQALLLFAGSGKDYMNFDTQGRNVVIGSNYTTTNIGGKLIASGTSAMQAVTATTVSASSTLQVAGAATFATTVTGSRFRVTERLGINTDSLISLDVHYTGSGDPTNLSNDTGGGEVIYFGTSSANLSAGGVYYLNSAGGWASVDSANTGSGHNQLLGIALGTKPSANGMLVKGYFDMNAFYSGSFIKGGPVYIQSSSAATPSVTGGGYLSGAAPTNADSYVRVVGYGTDTANVIYFNPDSTYVELT